MSNNEALKIEDNAGGGKQLGMDRHVDQRIRRTHERLGSALVELIEEKPIDAITVQEVLDRASVGRSTFYLHFRSKDDLLVSQLEMFLEKMSTMLSAETEASLRVMPVTEMFAHIGGPQNKMYRALADAGRLNDFYELAQGYFTRAIARRLRETGRLAKMSKRELDARASALAGSLLSLMRWWMDHGGKESPECIDAMFHQMAWVGVA